MKDLISKNKAYLISLHIITRTVDDERKRKELRDATVAVLDSQVRAVNQRKEDEAAARRQEIQGEEMWRFNM
jgi:hypothetical protein